MARFSAADDLRAAIGLWAAWLSGERRASAHTIAAYGRDLAFFLDFLTEHLGEVPGSRQSTRCVRPISAPIWRAARGEGIERSSLARGMSVLRSFVRFLQRRGLASTTALAALRSPKLPPGVPKPLTIDDAVAAVDAAGDFHPKAGRAGATPLSWRCSMAAGCGCPRRSGSAAPRRRPAKC